MGRILVMSDSHAALRYMRQALAAVKPDAVIHLGDYFDDGDALSGEYSHLTFHQVPGNCDRYRCPTWDVQMLCYDVCGVRLFMTHGHNHGVKSGVSRLIVDARRYGAQAALYGHTHIPDCQQLEDGMWLLNPGTCGHSAGSVGLIETEDGKILSCCVLPLESLFD